MTWSPNFPDVKEEHGTRSWSIDGESSRGTVSLFISADQAEVFATDLLVNERPWPFNSVIPIQLFARSVSVEYPREKYTTNVEQNLITYTGQARIVVEYRVPNYGTGGPPGDIVTDPNTGEQVTIVDRIEPATEFLSLQTKDVGWANATFGNPATYVPLKTGEEIGKMIPTEKFIRTVSGLSTNGISQISNFLGDLRGKINNSDHYSNMLKAWFRKGTLLFLDPTFTIQQTFTSVPSLPGEPGNQVRYDRSWDISIALQHRNVGKATDPSTGNEGYVTWNWYWRAETQKWEQMWDLRVSTPTSGTPYKIYDEADFSKWLWPSSDPEPTE